jgi:teichoic acid transport system ATP-binding protein
MKDFCNKILWLEYGKVRDFGTVDEIIPKYEKFLSDYKKMTKEQKMEFEKQKYVN